MDRKIPQIDINLFILYFQEIIIRLLVMLQVIILEVVVEILLSDQILISSLQQGQTNLISEIGSMELVVILVSELLHQTTSSM